MRQHIHADWVRGAIIAFILIGIVLVVLGVVQFVSTSIALDNNLAYQVRTGEQPATAGSNTEARGLVASDLERRDLVQERYNALIMGGAGLILLSIGWIGFDVARNRKKSSEKSPSSATS